MADVESDTLIALASHKEGEALDGNDLAEDGWPEARPGSGQGGRRRPGFERHGLRCCRAFFARPIRARSGCHPPARQRGALLGERISAIYQGIVEVLDEHMPGSFAIEQLHSHVQHPRTAILMAHARGAIVLAAAQRGIPVVSYAATRIKKTLTGSGRRTQGADPACDQDRARPGCDPGTARRRRCVCGCAVPFSYQPQSAGVENGLM